MINFASVNEIEDKKVFLICTYGGSEEWRIGMATAGCFSEHEFIYMIWLWR